MSNSRSTSGYMLMYRIVDKTEDRANLNVHDDEIPDDIKLDVAESEVQAQIVHVQDEKKTQRMQLKVIYRPKETVLAPETDVEIAQRVYYVDRLEDTYNSFFDTVYRDIVGDDNQTKQRENFRLRAYNV